MNLLDQIKITNQFASTHGTKGCMAAATTWFDMSEWENILFILNKSATSIGSSGVARVQMSSALSTGAGIVNSTIGLIHWATGGAGQTRAPAIAIDVIKPVKRYTRLRLLTCTGTFVTTIQYKGRRLGSTEATINMRGSTGTGNLGPATIFVATT